jgi:hypothetical protein
MKIEGKYLSKNYHIENETIYNTMKEKTSWFIVVNDIKDTFTHDLAMAQAVVNTWCVEQGIDIYEKVVKEFRYFGVITSNKFETIFPIRKFEYAQTNNGMDEINLDSMRQRIVARLPEYELNLNVSFNDLDEPFKNFLIDFPLSVIVEKQKIDLVIVDTRTNSRFISKQTLLTKITTNVDADYDEDDGYLANNIRCTMEFKPDMFKVEY